MSKRNTSFLHNWVEVGGPNSGIVREVNTGREGERGLVALDPIFSTADEEFIYSYRKETSAPFVNAYGSEVLTYQKPTTAQKKNKEVMSQLTDNYAHMAVITERIPHRLANAPQLTYPESLYVLDRALEGYGVAYDKVGPFRVNNRMIGFNNQGEAKVWVNEQFAENHPSYPIRRLASTKEYSHLFLEGYPTDYEPATPDEADMVQDVVDTVENHSEEGRFLEPFASEIRQKGISFAEARRRLHQTIIQGRIPVPNRIDLFTNMVRGYRKVTTTGVKEITTTTTTVQPGKGYKFNYLPYKEPFNPEIFASSFGEHGVHKGVYY